MHQQMKRGFLRFYLLKLLGEGPRSGYDLIKRIAAETGYWKPSPGSVYPLLQTLEDRGWITQEGEGDRERKAYHITAAGRSALQEAKQAKADALESLKRSFDVFIRVFGDPGGEVEDWMKQLRFGEPLGQGLPPQVRPRLFTLRHLLMNLPFERLDEEQIQHISHLLDEAIAGLGAYADVE